jgi:hypothetical protein
VCKVLYIPENGEGGEGRSDVGVPEKTQKKPSEIYMYAINFYFIAMSAKHFPQQRHVIDRLPMQYTQVAIFLMSANQELPLVTFTEQPTPHPFHQIEGNKGFSL